MSDETEKVNVVETYNVVSDDIGVEVDIIEREDAFVREYFLNFPSYGPGTTALLENLKSTLVAETNIQTEKLLDPEFIESMKQKFRTRADALLSKELPKMSPETKKALIGILLHEMLGLGKIEFFLADGNLEEIVINQSREPVWVYHKKYGWLRTNVFIESEDGIQNYASIIARRVGKQITTLNPLLDAHLITGDRANATLMPISSKGNTITIRRFRREPWTVTDLIENNTVSSELMAFLWEAIEYELNVVFSGGTASGKTTMLGICLPFIQPNHRMLSIEDSIVGDSKILIERNGAMEHATVGELIDSFVDSNNEDAIIENATGIKVFSMTPHGKIELTKPSKFIRHKVRKLVLEITLESGKKISVTEDHSLFTLNNNGEISAVSGKTLKEGEFIATPRELDYAGSTVNFDLANNLDAFDGCFVKDSEFSLIAKHSKELPQQYFAKSTVDQAIRENYANVKMVTCLKENIETGAIASRLGPSLPIAIELDENLATVAGLWLADGCYDKNSILVSVVEEECRAEVIKLAERFKCNVKMHSDGITLMVNSRPARLFFEKVMGLQGNSFTKKFPAWAFGLPRKELAAIIRGYLSGDGWLRKDEVVVRSASEEMITDLQTLLLRFGIPLRFKRKRLKDKTFEARISGRKFLRLFNEIGFLQKKKQEKLLNLLSKKSHDVSDVVPLPKALYKEIGRCLKAAIGKRYKYQYWKGWARHYKKSHIGRELLKELVEGYCKDSPLFNKLKAIAFSDVFWERIEKINKIDFEGFVYDFSVPNNESFVCQNIIAHNTRELQAPEFLHWVPLTTREPNPEGKGGVSMLDLLVNSLRMRPDRIIVGEIRRQREAEVMFEAMHTGHSVYTTVHANTADETIRRLINPPISTPVSMLDAVHLNLVMFRNRRLGVRRVLQVAEYVLEKRGEGQESVKANVLYRWRGADDKIVSHAESIRFFDELSLHTGLNQDELIKEIKTKQKILDWMVKQKICKVNDVGRVMAEYYMDPDSVKAAAEKNKPVGR